jgi:hypothetical protein
LGGRRRKGEAGRASTLAYPHSMAESFVPTLPWNAALTSHL